MKHPYQWVLKYKARLEEGSLAALPSGKLLKGSLVHRLIEDFLQSSDKINKELRTDLPALRRRSRQMVKDNPIYRRYLSADQRSVIGPRGIRLQMQVVNPDGSFDAPANDVIEGA